MSTMWKVVKHLSSIAKLVRRNRVFSLEVIKLLVSAQQSEPAANTLFARGRRIFDFRVVLEACTVAELRVVAVLANWKDVVSPGAVNAAANA